MCFLLDIFTDFFCTYMNTKKHLPLNLIGFRPNFREGVMVGVERFELPYVGIRIRSLTAWRYPNIEK